MVNNYACTALKRSMKAVFTLAKCVYNDAIIAIEIVKRMALLICLFKYTAAVL